MENACHVRSMELRMRCERNVDARCLMRKMSLGDVRLVVKGNLRMGGFVERAKQGQWQKHNHLLDVIAVRVARRL